MFYLSSHYYIFFGGGGGGGGKVTYCTTLILVVYVSTVQPNEIAPHSPNHCEYKHTTLSIFDADHYDTTVKRGQDRCCLPTSDGTQLFRRHAPNSGCNHRSRIRKKKFPFPSREVKQTSGGQEKINQSKKAAVGCDLRGE